jgi:hypothetical protein
MTDDYWGELSGGESGCNGEPPPLVCAPAALFVTTWRRVMALLARLNSLT